MSGIYFHIPFCKRLCGYCDFKRSVMLRYIPQTVECMHAELDAQSEFLKDKRVKTIYFGGGTPSLLEPSVLGGLIEHTKRLFDCDNLEEVTVELNPDDVTSEYAERLHSINVNRVSLGIQSFDDDELRFMGRRHTAEQAERAVKRLKSAGFDNISVDLIFGVAGFGDEALRMSLERVLSLGVQHISAYHLTIERGTRFGRLLASGAMMQVDDERSEREFLMVHNLLTASGFDHYEVSNYALDGFRSRHNFSYWTGDEYLGIGAGAHSYSGDVRRWCEQSVDEYISGVIYGSESLSQCDKLNEYIMTSLRCVVGVSLPYIAENFGEEEANRIGNLAGKFIDSGLLRRVEDDNNGIRLVIPSDKFLLSDMVISALFE